MLYLSKFEVFGHSMQPTLSPKQQVLVSKIPYLFKSPKIGDIVVFKKDKKYLIKRIQKITRNNYYVYGDNQNDSQDSHSFGGILKSDIVGKVVLTI